ncbi:MAG: hypothetical protein QOI38_506 [Sphingomonadales bacterium]|jgi:DNA-binding GntR family transcriptional regulator|nr:hypothetical protein [Sphingomonadales bacterium]
MSPGPTFDRVYLALKEQLMSGRFAPGDHLEPTTIGEELNASITPVRDALHRLVGERMVEAPRNDGFRAPAPTEAELRDLYGWNCRLIELALGRRASARAALLGTESAEAPDMATFMAADLFRLIARRSGSPEQERAVENLSDRLGALRVTEQRLFEDAGEELSSLVAAFREGDVAALRRGVGTYHRRRQRHVPEILVAARTPVEEIP